MVETNFEKLKLEVQTIEKTLSGRVSKLNSSLTDIDSEISTMNVSLQTVKDKVASYRKNVQNMESELANLTREEEEVSRNLELKEGMNKQNEDDKIELNIKKTGLEADITKSESVQRELAKNIEEKEKSINVVKEALLNAEKLYEEKVASIENEINDLATEIQNKGNQYKVLRKLIQDNYIKDSQYDVCKVLKQPGVDTLDKVVLSSGVDKNTVSDTIKELISRGVIAFNEGTEVFTMTKDYDI